MLDQLVQAFTASTQGQTAMSRLQAQGFPPQQAQSFLQTALPSAAQAMHGAQQGGIAPNGPQGMLDVGGSHYGTNFLSGAVSSLLRGQGLMGAAVDGMQGVVGGHVAEVIAVRFGLPPRVAGTIGAIVTPLAIDFLWQRMQGGQLNLGSLFGGQGAGPSAPAMPGWGGAAAPVMPAMPAMPGWGGGATAMPAMPAVPAMPGWGGGATAGPPGTVSPTVEGGLGAIFGQLFRG